MAVKCRDIMTADPVCCSPSDSVDDVAQLMKDQDIGPVLVCDGEDTRRLVGIVTDRDLVVAVLAEGRDPKATSIGEVMSRNVAACRPDDDLDMAIRMMEERQVRRIPIVDREGRILGIVSQADVATRWDRNDRTAEVVEAVSKPRSRAGGA